MRYLTGFYFLFIQLSFLLAQSGPSQEGNVDNLPVRQYELIISQQMVNITGKDVMGMAINSSIPGPSLRFIEGEYAIIKVTNAMEVETSVHWHGLLLPNFYDGVPYLNTPPIEPGESFTYEFALKQSGTYWYHSHTMLQEQAGVYGSFVIEPKERTLEYDTDLVMVLSDWTDDKPMNVLRNLKRGNEWFGIKKGTATPLNQVIARGALGAQVNFWKQRMEGADIADVYYPAFLINGKPSQTYPDFEPGEKVRLRFINAAASTYFWLTFGGNDPLLVASDGLDVVPVNHNKTLIGIAETYDFIVTVPDNGQLEIRAMAQDGSGFANSFLGKGDVIPAPVVPRPDKIQMMKMMAQMDMKMGAPALKLRPGKDERFEMKETYGMQMNEEGAMDEMPGMKHHQHSDTRLTPSDSMQMDQGKMPMENTAMDHAGMNHGNKSVANMANDAATATTSGMLMGDMNMYSEFNYDYLKSPTETAFSQDLPVKEILLNLTGNMNRYVWSLNGVPIAETDEIKIAQGQVTRIRLNNLTMMHHPMHLHGHFFRVVNKNGSYSPLKHTVNVPPMQEVTIEFYGNEYGDWFFHCHVLYHMMGGMARVFSYDTPRDERMEAFPTEEIIKETDLFYTWGMVDAASQMTALNLTSANIRNQFNLSAEFGYNDNIEAEFSYERYLYDYVRVFGGVNVENTIPDNLDSLSVTAVAGLRYLTPYLFNLDVRIDNQLRPRIGIGRSIMIFPRLSVFGYYEYQADFGLISDFENGVDYESETVWSSGLEYLLGKNISLMANYDNRFGAGGGLSIRF